MAQIFAMPLIMFLPGHHSEGAGKFEIAFAGVYLGLIPMTVVDLMRFSDHWQAADVYRAGPLPGPALLCHGARRAILVLIALPLMVGGAALAWGLTRDVTRLGMLLPAILVMPLYALLPCRGGRSVPLSAPVDGSKPMERGVEMIGAMLGSAALAGIAGWAAYMGWLWWMLGAEAAMPTKNPARLNASVEKARWPSLD